MNEEPRAQRVLRRGPKGVSLVGDAYGYTAQPHTLQAHRIARQFGCGQELAAVIAGLAYGSVPETWRARA